MFEAQDIVLVTSNNSPFSNKILSYQLSSNSIELINLEFQLNLI